jgi:hypothetical protein
MAALECRRLKGHPFIFVRDDANRHLVLILSLLNQLRSGTFVEIHTCIRDELRNIDVGSFRNSLVIDHPSPKSPVVRPFGKIPPALTFGCPF